MVSVTPVGNYFGKGGVQGIHASVSLDYDRAAPRGTGDVKAGGNYAADLLPLKVAKEQGFGTTLYLDAAEVHAHDAITNRGLRTPPSSLLSLSPSPLRPPPPRRIAAKIH